MSKTHLDELVEIQCVDGNWNHDAYMLGMANGLILAQATVNGVEPVFLSAPETWLSDNPSAFLETEASQ